jgi:hypothetical protein
MLKTCSVNDNLSLSLSLSLSLACTFYRRYVCERRVSRRRYAWPISTATRVRSRRRSSGCAPSRSRIRPMPNLCASSSAMCWSATVVLLSVFVCFRLLLYRLVNVLCLGGFGRVSTCVGCQSSIDNGRKLLYRQIMFVCLKFGGFVARWNSQTGAAEAQRRRTQRRRG